MIDLQPGRGSFLEQAKKYQELLELPNVGLALDPEWKLGPNEKPLSRVGNTTAAEVNETTDWLAGLTREKKPAPKSADPAPIPSGYDSKPRTAEYQPP